MLKPIHVPLVKQPKPRLLPKTIVILGATGIPQSNPPARLPEPQQKPVLPVARLKIKQSMRRDTVWALGRKAKHRPAQQTVRKNAVAQSAIIQKQEL